MSVKAIVIVVVNTITQKSNSGNHYDKKKEALPKSILVDLILLDYTNILNTLIRFEIKYEKYFNQNDKNL